MKEINNSKPIAKCESCGYVWVKFTLEPKSCPRCKRYIRYDKMEERKDEKNIRNANNI